MSCQNLMKALKLMFPCKQILSCGSYASVLRHQKINYKTLGQFLPSASFGTSVKCWCLPIPDYDPRIYYYDRIKGIKIVLHEDNPEMPEVNLTAELPDGERIPFKARIGNTIMRAIEKHNETNEIMIPMEASCGGNKACTTCHLFCDEWESDYFTPADESEDDLLDGVPQKKLCSRLGCQMRIMKEFKHIDIVLPKSTVNFAANLRKRGNS